MKIFYAILFGAALIVGALAWKGYLNPKPLVYVAPAQSTSTEQTSLPAQKEVSVVAVGDVMLDRGVRQVVEKVFDNDYSRMFEFVKTNISEADISMFNLEGPVSDKGTNVGSIYSFRMATSTLPVLKDVGFDVASFVNNHVGDWGRLAFEDTLTRVGDAGLLLTGAGFSYASATEPVIIEKNGITFGFLGFSDVGPVHLKAGSTTAGILLLSDPNLESIVRNAKSKVDQLIISVHWGEEYKTDITNRQQEFGHKLIDWGASLVVGHHPHVVEPVENYNNGVIAYSLGNFIFDQPFSNETMKGGVLEAVFHKDGLVRYEIKHVIMDKNFRPAFVENNLL
ncbi:MAG: CapA family protein [bacterium]